MITAARAALFFRLARLLVSVAALVLPPAMARTAPADDVIRLKVGTTVRGRITAENEKEVTIQTATGGMTLSRSDIKSLQKGSGGAPGAAAQPGKPDGGKPAEGTAGRTSESSGQEPKAGSNIGRFNVKIRPLVEDASARAAKWSAKAELCLVGAKVTYGKGQPYDAGFAFYYVSPEQEKVFMVTGKAAAGARLAERDSDALGPTRTLRMGKFVFVHRPLPAAWLDLHDAAAAALRAYEKGVEGAKPVKSCQIYLGYAAASLEEAKAGRVCLYWIADLGGFHVCLNGASGDVVEVAPVATKTAQVTTPQPVREETFEGVEDETPASGDGEAEPIPKGPARFGVSDDR